MFRNHALVAAMAVLCTMFCAIPAHAEDDGDGGVYTRHSMPTAAMSGAPILSVPLSPQAIYPAQYNGDVRDLPPVFTPPEYHTLNDFATPMPRRGAPSDGGTSAPQPSPVENAPMPGTLQNFAGLGFGTVVSGGTAGGGWPPDTNGDVGPTYYIQSVNTAYGIFNKTTGVMVASFKENQLWQGAGTGTVCDANHQGDPVVIHDGLADRWILTDFAFTFSGSNPAPPYYQCIAVSKTSDPVSGGWWLYAVRMDSGAAGAPPAGTFADYPKFGFWTDCLYMGANGFGTSAYAGGIYAAFDRTTLFSGAALTSTNSSIAFTGDTDIFGMFPANMLAGDGTDSSKLPPSGTPEYFVAESQTAYSFDVRKFQHGATACGAGASLSSPVSVSQASYGYPAIPSGTSYTTDMVRQPGGGKPKLDSLGDELMQRVVYRNIGGSESLWLSHTTCGSGADANGGCASSTTTTKPQWAQINVTGGTIATTPVQQQIYAPDTTLYRWMGSLAVDSQGNMAFGYSRANSSNNPGIYYAGRLATDTLNQLSQTETLMQAGSGVQNSYSRWGDYSSMTVDPTDDCTFWYTTEYYATTGTSWQTRIGSFKFPTCGVSNYTIGGSVSGLMTSGLVMAVTAGSQTVNVSAGASSYVFPTAEPTGTAYTVSVQTQPTGQTCTVANPTGTIGTSNVTNANVSCTTNTYTIGGSVSGLTASGLVMAVTAGSQTVSVSSGATSYVFPTSEPFGSSYTVSVQTQPTGQTCTVTNASGTIGTGNVTNANVSCTTNTYTIGGSVSGLTSSGLVMAVTAGSQTVSVSSGATSYVFPTAEPTGTAYTVSVQTQPTGQTCTVANPTGTIGAGNVTNANVSCTTNTYTIGGSVSGLTASGLVMAVTAGSQTVSVSSGATSYVFPTAEPFGSSYTVSVQTQPTGQTCTVTNASGTIGTGNVTNANVSCTTNTYTIGGSISGLSGTVQLKLDGTTPTSTQTQSFSANGSFTFTTPLQFGSGWTVSVQTQPTGQTCVVSGGSGASLSANVTTVSVTCTTNTFTVTASSGGNGTITPSSQSVNYNATASFTVNPATGYHVASVVGDTCTVTGSGTSYSAANIQANCAVTATFAIDTFTLTYTAGANGTISGTSPQSVNYGGNGSLVTAVPNTGYHFVQWSDGVLTAARTDSNVQANISVTATFAIDTFTLSYTAGANGTISGTSPQTVSYGGNGSLVTAVPNTGYHFVQWSDGVLTAARTDSNVQANISVTATFAIDTFTLTYTAGANGTISGTSPQTVNYGGNGSLVTAVPNTGYHFVQWSDGVMTAARTDSNVQANISVTATFAIDTFTLTYTAGANGTISGTSPQTVNYGGNGSLVTAVPNTGYHFVQWSDGVMTAARTDSNVQANISVTATFAIDTFTLTYTAGANGTISGTSPQTVSYGGNGSLVTAVPSTGYHFVQWSDGVLTAARTDSNVQANISVTATFAIDTFTVTFKDWDGSILSSQTVNYGSAATAPSNPTRTGYTFTGWDVPFSNVTANLTVTAQYTIDQFTVTFKDWDGSILSSQTVNYGSAATAPSNPTRTGYTFTGWDVPFSNITANLTVTAQYTIDQFTLTYAAGTGGSINGNSSQTVDYQGNGTAVGAAPDAGYHFVQWSDGITDNPRTDANVTADVDVTAQFAANVLVFTVQPADVAQGSTLGTVEVTEQDGSGNTIVDTATVDLTLVTACGTLDLGSVQMVDGVATLNSSQRFYTLHSGYQITATVTNPNPTPMAAVLSTTFDATASAELVFSDGFESCRP